MTKPNSNPLPEKDQGADNSQGDNKQGLSWKTPLKTSWKAVSGGTGAVLGGLRGLFYKKPGVPSEDGRFKYYLMDINTVRQTWDFERDPEGRHGREYRFSDRSVETVFKTFVVAADAAGEGWDRFRDRQPHDETKHMAWDDVVAYGVKAAEQVLADADDPKIDVPRYEVKLARKFIEYYQPDVKPAEPETRTLDPYRKVQP